MKKYTSPEAEVISVDKSDVISTSGGIVLPGAPVSANYNSSAENENAK